MKIALINNGPSAGGLRFEASLIRGLRRVRPNWNIAYFSDLSLLKEDHIKQELQINCCEINDYRTLDVKLNKPNLSKDLGVLPTTSLSSFDAAIFTWPYDFSCPDLKIPILFVPHDFNFFYFFDSLSFSKEYVEAIYQNLEAFFQSGIPVVSTQFIKQEVTNFFPVFASKTNVVTVAVMSNLPEISKQREKEILEKFSLYPLYFLYPCSSVKPYKNLGVLAVAIHHLKQRGIDAQMVYIGNGTDQICGTATINGVCQNFNNQIQSNVRGLGFVSDEELVALMRGSQAVVTSSLYEAANGPAIDAWNCGVPVAMSNLPFYTEHLSHSDVRAALFDPKNASNVADTLEIILNHQDQMLEDALYSKKRIKETTSLVDFADGYAQLIERFSNG